MKTHALCFLLLCLTSASRGAETISEHLQFTQGGINSATVERNGARLAIYGLPAEDASLNQTGWLLVTHHRRDVLTPALAAGKRGAKIAAPAKERPLIERPQEFWNKFTKSRFHDYDQQTTKILRDPLPVHRWVEEGDIIEWNGFEFEVLDTPGYTRGAVSYLAKIDGKTVAFTGDLIYGDGQLFDLYSFQDAIPEAGIRGYHGYGSRLAALITSLEKIAAEKPTLIIPARGPLIRNPEAAIARLISRVRALYKNYLSTNALFWYFKEERMRACGERILGKGAPVDLMPYSLHQKAPDWVFEHSTSRLLISDSGAGFLLDCGYQGVIDAVKKLLAMGVVNRIEGIFVTHYHDDHSDMVAAAAKEFQCPVYATAEYADILENPGAYHLPAMTSNPIPNIRVKGDGETMKWHEFELAFHFFPGQSFYHGALLAKRGADKPIFFIGDSFAPSGIDDYCVPNRNLLHEGAGYLLCFSKLRQLPADFWLVNEHIPFVFSYSHQELNSLETRYRQRIEISRELFPWDDPNYGIDEQWAVFYPYGAELQPDAAADFQVRLTNHSPVTRTFKVTARPPPSMKVLHPEASLTLGPRASGKIAFKTQAPSKLGNYLLTADIESEGIHLQEWVEALITVKN